MVIVGQICSFVYGNNFDRGNKGAWEVEVRKGKENWYGYPIIEKKIKNTFKKGLIEH